MFKKVLQRRRSIATKKVKNQYILSLNTNVARKDTASAQ